MDSAKKKLFHHTKKEDEDKKVKSEEVEEVDPLDDVDEEAESNQSASAKAVVDDEPDESEQVDEKPMRNPAPITEEVSDEDEQGAPGPKINFDYQNQGPAPMNAPAQPGTPLDDLANENQEVYDQTDRPMGGQAQRPMGNPYAQGPQGGEYGIKSIRQPQMQPNFPASPAYGGTSQNMNPNRQPGQFAPGPNQGNFNFRREGNTRSGSNSKIYFVVLLAIGLIVLGGAVYLLKNQLKPAGPKPTPTPEAAISTPEPSPTPVPLDRSKFTLRVLNGSGKTGLAATVADKLKTLGYKIEKTGNATNSAFPQTLVRTQNDQELADQLTKDLSDQSYTAASGSALKSTDTSDAEVILGAK